MRFVLKQKAYYTPQQLPPRRIALARINRLLATIMVALWREQPPRYRLAAIIAVILLAFGRSLGFVIPISLGWMVDQLQADSATIIILGLMAVYASSMVFSSHAG